jgi:predicted Zn-dependent peptidase
VLRVPGAPITEMILGFHAAPATAEDAAVRVAFLQSRQLNYFRRPSELGIEHRVRPDRDSLQDDVQVFAAHEDEGLDYLGRIVGAQSIEWPSDRFQRWASLRRTEEALPVPRAERAFWTALWGDQSSGVSPLVADVEQVEGRAIERWVERVRRPGNGVLIVVGDVDADHIFQRGEAALGSWGKGGASPDPLPAPPALRAEGNVRMMVQPVASRPAATVHLGCLMPAINDEGQRTVNRLLTRFLDERLHETLRMQAGASYAPHVTAIGLRGGTDALDAWADVDPSGLPLAVSALQGFVDQAAPLPFDGAMLERLRWTEARESNLRTRTSRDLARALFARWNLGWPLATLDELPLRLAAVTLPDLERALRTCRANAVLSVIGDTRALPPPSSSSPVPSSSPH